MPAVSWLQHLGPHLGDTVLGGNQPQAPLLESTWTSGLTHRRPEARTQTPSLQRQVGTSGGWTGLSRGSLQHARPLRMAARRREGWPVRESREQRTARSGWRRGGGAQLKAWRVQWDGSLHHSRAPATEPTGGGGTELAHGARAEHGRGAGGDTDLPLPVSWAAPSRCCPSSYEAGGRWGRVGVRPQSGCGPALVPPELSWGSQKPLATSLSTRGRDTLGRGM